MGKCCKKYSVIFFFYINFLYKFSQSLQELNVLLDTLKVLKSTYITLITVTDSTANDPKTTDRILASKGFQFCTRKKALSEAQKIIHDAKEKREKANCLEGADKNLFFNELRKMRENWRIRKINDAVFGDLSYRICK